LGSVAEFFNGDRGKNYPTHADRVVSGVPFINTGHIEPSGRLTSDGMDYITRESFDRLRGGKVKKGDIVYCLRGSTIGKTARNHFAEGAIASSLVIVRAKEIACQDYLYFYLSSPYGQQLAGRHDNGSAQPNLSVRELSSYPLPLPPVSEQRAIAQLLGTLDDRINLLRETNATLEAIALALFKSWFVEFDPVRAKIEGRSPHGIDEVTAALFPDTLVESELGLVPKGWRVVSVYDISRVTYGAPFASKLFKAEPPGKPLVRIRDLKDERPGVYTEEVHPKGYLLRPGDITVGMDGEFRAYVWGGESAWLNQRVCVFHPINGACSAFVRFSIAPLLAAVEASETATTVIHLGKNDIDRFKVVLPSPEILSAFADLANPIYDRLVANKQQAQNLAALRDTLLPRLIAGQLRIAEFTE
jgi:type I restriction enzyme, S subunit